MRFLFSNTNIYCLYFCT